MSHSKTFSSTDISEFIYEVIQSSFNMVLGLLSAPNETRRVMAVDENSSLPSALSKLETIHANTKTVA